MELCKCKNPKHGAFGCSIDAMEGDRYDTWCKNGCLKRSEG